MADKQLYLLATFDEETSRKMADLDNLLKQAGFSGTQTQGIPHHFTMASFDPAREDEINHMLRQVCGATPCFSLPFHHIGLFGLKVLFLAPDVNEELLSLHQKLSLGQPDGKNGWSAHVTLLIDAPEEILKALPIVAEHFNGFMARVKSVSLYEFFPARFIAEYPLQANREE